MQKEKEAKQWSQKAVLEMQNEYFEVIEQLTTALEKIKAVDNTLKTYYIENLVQNALFNIKGQ